MNRYQRSGLHSVWRWLEIDPQNGCPPPYSHSVRVSGWPGPTGELMTVWVTGRGGGGGRTWKVTGQQGGKVFGANFYSIRRQPWGEGVGEDWGRSWGGLGEEAGSGGSVLCCRTLASGLGVIFTTEHQWPVCPDESTWQNKYKKTGNAVLHL